MCHIILATERRAALEVKPSLGGSQLLESILGCFNDAVEQFQTRLEAYLHVMGGRPFCKLSDESAAANAFFAHDVDCSQCLVMKLGLVFR